MERTTQLNEAKERIETILNSSLDVIIFCWTDETIDRVNPAFGEAFGCPDEEIYNQPLATLALPEQSHILEQIFKTVVKTRQPQRLETRFQYKASKHFDGEMLLSPVFGAGQDLIGVLCSLRDISERKKMEIQLRQLLAHEMHLSELKSHYMAMAAHDLRNPLAAIQMSVNRLERQSDRMTGEQKQARYDGIYRNIEMMSHLLKDVLTIGQAESGKLKFEPEKLDLIAFSQALVDELQQVAGNEQRIQFLHHGVCDSVQIDARLLQHILSNLLSNALKYSPTDSTVRFEIQCESDGVTFRVQDRGIGIPQSDQAQLFDPFHRAGNVGKISGTGLGLAIVKEAVERHGGTIAFNSEEGSGTTFTVILPQTSPER